MIEFGNTLRTARESKGYTVAQLAEMTRLAPSAVEDLEREDFTRIPAPIYGRGFVKLYCEAVGLDPKPLIAEFMEIFNGNHDTSIKERPTKQQAVPAVPLATEPPRQEGNLFLASEPPPKPEPPPTPEPTTAPEPQLVQEPLLVPETITATEPPPAPHKPIDTPEQAKPEPTTMMDDLFSAAEQTHEPRLSRYAAPVSQSPFTEPPASIMSPSLWRIATLACVAIVLLWLGFLCLRSLYRATNTTIEHQESTNATEVEESKPEKPKANPEIKTEVKTDTKPAAKRTPQAIPAFYID